MKIILTVAMATALSLQAFAGEPTDISKSDFRTSKCEGSVNVNGNEVSVTATIVDSKYTEKFEDGDSFDEYSSTVTITNVENPSKKLAGAVTSTETSEDNLVARTTEDGPAYYDLYSNKAATIKAGLLIVACDVQENGKCKSAEGKITKHAIAVLANENGSVVEDGSRQYPGQMTCTAQ